MTFQRSLLGLLALSVILSGCASTKTVLYPIQDADIVIMKEGQSYTPKKDGYFLSKLYVSEVMDAKVEKAKK